MNFLNIKNAVAAQFNAMTVSGRLFLTNVSKDEMWETYLKAFPEGTNPIFRERTEHDCNCCKNFIRAVGNVVEIVGDKVVTIWDNYPHEDGYKSVAEAMAKLVRESTIVEPFFHHSNFAGHDKNLESINGVIKEWNHFYVKIPKQFVKTVDRGTAVNDFVQKRNVMVRGLNEITVDALDTVIELTAQNSLYRGADFLDAVEEFKRLKTTNWMTVPGEKRELHSWVLTYTQPPYYALIRNTVIGTLLQDLSEGMDIEVAVRAYESKVAPANYKRPTSLVTPAMVNKAKETLEALGMVDSLQRRHANIHDVNVNDILFVQRDKQATDVFSELATARSSLKHVETVTIDKFLADVLPTAKSVELLFEGRHQKNLVSIVAPMHNEAKKIFKWNNGFSWSYNGGVTDAIKERVKAAGGNVTGEARFSLSWHNYDDLDLHLVTPEGEINFRNKRVGSGRLDVDMNAGGGSTREPVENIFYETLAGMRNGEYRLFVHNWSKRETSNVGFTVQVELQGEVTDYHYDKAVNNDQKIDVLQFTKRNGVITINKSLDGIGKSTEVWSVKTGSFVPVSTIMLSPNYWGDNYTGNKHYFFMLEGCLNPDSPRGFYNEFLHSDLEQHRKVMEILGSKTLVPYSDQQLSGLGFSVTQHTEFVVRVKGATTRTLKVTV